ncbi:MAG: amino acid ABC transporter substrate-binding protein [Erysipelotrichaceae bacterium]
MKKILLCMLSLVCVISLNACSNKGEEQDKKSLVIGIDNTFAPMGFKNDEGKIVGFDVDVAKEVAKKIDKKISFQNIDWDLKETELETGNIDLIWNGYSVTPKRKKMVLFSDAYLKNRQIIITTDKTGIQSKADIAGKSLSVQKNSSAYEAVMKETTFVEGLKGSAPIQFETNNDCFMDLEAGRSNVIVVDETLARYYMMQQDNDINYVVLDENFGTEDYAVGMRKSDSKLCKSINKALEELKEDGTFDKIKDKWFK